MRKSFQMSDEVSSTATRKAATIDDVLNVIKAVTEQFRHDLVDEVLAEVRARLSGGPKDIDIKNRPTKPDTLPQKARPHKDKSRQDRAQKFTKFLLGVFDSTCFKCKKDVGTGTPIKKDELGLDIASRRAKLMSDWKEYGKAYVNEHYEFWCRSCFGNSRSRKSKQRIEAGQKDSRLAA